MLVDVSDHWDGGGESGGLEIEAPGMKFQRVTTGASGRAGDKYSKCGFNSCSIFSTRRSREPISPVGGDAWGSRSNGCALFPASPGGAAARHAPVASFAFKAASTRANRVSNECVREAREATYPPPAMSAAAATTRAIKQSLAFMLNWTGRARKCSRAKNSVLVKRAETCQFVLKPARPVQGRGRARSQI